METCHDVFMLHFLRITVSYRALLYLYSGSRRFQAFKRSNNRSPIISNAGRYGAVTDGNSKDSDYRLDIRNLQVCRYVVNNAAAQRVA